LQTPLDVYLGNLGPLQLRVYQATPPGPLTAISPFLQQLTGPPVDPGGPSDATATTPTSASPRYIPSGPLHTIVIVEMPPLADVMKALEDDALPNPAGDASRSNRQTPDGEGRNGSVGPPPPPSIAGRSLPLLFIRASDGVGYHSGRTIACENVFHTMDLGGMAPPNGTAGNIDTGWLAAAQVAAAAEGGLHGWTLRVM